MKLYFIRHPQTSWNKDRLFQGIKEGAVTLEGKSETSVFVKNLNIAHVDIIYSADNRRCMYLAKELLKKFPKSLLIKNFKLNERSFGKLEGTSELEFAKNTDFVFSDMEARYKWRPEDGESLEDVSIRVKNFLIDIKSDSENNKTILVVTSGGVMKVVAYLLSVKSLDEAMQTKYKNLEVLEIIL